MLRLTQTETLVQRKKTALITAFAVGCILFVVTWLGAPLMMILGIHVAPFQFAGGFVVFLLALSMLRAEQSPMKQTKEEQKEAVDKESVAVTPLAIPLIAGPGAISTVVVKASLFPDFSDLFLMTLIALSVALIMGSVLYFANIIERLLGRVGINIFTRIGGLILASNSVETLSQGIMGMFPSLSS